jgi:AcrR family transcriptional regulator
LPDQPVPDEPLPDAPAVSRREQAVARSLDPARARAETRVQRFLDAALELMDRADGREFTVQEVVEQSGQSLRSFYQYFAGKHELLLAVFEESVRSTAEHLQAVIADEDGAIARLRTFTVEYYRLCRPAPRDTPTFERPTPALGLFAQQLLTDHPKEAARAYLPLVSLLECLLDDAAAAGGVRHGLNHRRIAGVVLQAISFNMFSRTISGPTPRGDRGAPPDELWETLLHGIGTGIGTGARG